MQGDPHAVPGEEGAASLEQQRQGQGSSLNERTQEMDVNSAGVASAVRTPGAAQSPSAVDIDPNYEDDEGSDNDWLATEEDDDTPDFSRMGMHAEL